MNHWILQYRFSVGCGRERPGRFQEKMKGKDLEAVMETTLLRSSPSPNTGKERKHSS